MQILKVINELVDQTQNNACSGGCYTQTVDVEGEVNGLMTYDRELSRPNADQWKSTIQSLYNAAKNRGGA